MLGSPDAIAVDSGGAAYIIESFQGSIAIVEARVLVLGWTARLKDMPDPAISLPVLESAARWCADFDPARAARWLGAAVGNREALGTPLLPYARGLVDAIVGQLVAKLGEYAYRTAAGEGRALSIDEGLAEAERVLGD